MLAFINGAQGVIWPRVAEVALVGALECGGFLVQLVLEEMEASVISADFLQETLLFCYFVKRVRVLSLSCRVCTALTRGIIRFCRINLTMSWFKPPNPPLDFMTGNFEANF